MERKQSSNECKHPPTRTYSWFAYNYKTDKNDILCAGCCDCGEILAGGITLEEIDEINKKLEEKQSV